ncbi:RNA polymerase sigma factor [Allorhizobium undicola]|uniref:RNA polymerase sigma factor n=1 Tax=Allorhizobium undicola TaxID=78527 RepID=UPI003D3390A5
MSSGEWGLAADGGNVMDDPDAPLLKGVAEGDPVALRRMVERKLPRILTLARAMLGDAAEAEDVAQETFLRIWRQAQHWQPGRARFDSWIHRVAVNLCYDRLRRRKESPTDDVPELVDPAPLPDADGAEGETLRLELALGRIAPRQRLAITLVYYQGLSNREAAEIMETSVDALESLLARGRRALHDLLLTEQGESLHGGKTG